MSSNLGPLDEKLMRLIGWCWRRLSPTARRWLVVELQRQDRQGGE